MIAAPEIINSSRETVADEFILFLCISCNIFNLKRSDCIMYRNITVTLSIFVQYAGTVLSFLSRSIIFGRKHLVFQNYSTDRPEILSIYSAGQNNGEN